MDMAEMDSVVEPEKVSVDTGNYHTSNLSSDWQANGNNVISTSIEMISMDNSMMESSTRSSTSMMDSICPQICDQPVNNNRRSFFYSDANVQINASTLRSHSSVRTSIGWKPNQILRGGILLPDVPGVRHQSFLNFPADSEFVERAALFSSFSGGNFREMMNSFSVPDHPSPYSGGFASMQRPSEIFGANGLKFLDKLQTHSYEVNLAEGSKEASLPIEHDTEVNSIKNEKTSLGFLWSQDEVKIGVDASGNEYDGAEVNNGDSLKKLEGAEEESGGKGVGSRKREGITQNIDPDEINKAPQPLIETEKRHTQIKLMGDQNPTSTSKPVKKPGKQGSQGSDSPKEEYIHVRARRGQATNSHSLAERVRREKISERMKYLQDLVPGCSKVTGKAVMLDEIINYVQSLQRQVEFLSMKLATVDPLLDFNVHAILAKNILQPRTCVSSSLVFPSDMAVLYPPQHPSHQGLIQSGISGLGNSSDTLQRAINLQSTVVRAGFKEPESQVPTIWEDELHSVVQMGFNPSSSISKQDLSDSAPHCNMKAEP